MKEEVIFKDRQDAGRKLAEQLTEYAGLPEALILALPRGGVPVAHAVAHKLGIPFDVFIVRKLSVPGQEELAMGAIASGAAVVLNPDVVMAVDIPDSEIERIAEIEAGEIEVQEEIYRRGRKFPNIKGKTIIVVDDGLATGATMRSALAAIRKLGAEKIICAVPTAPPETCAAMEEYADDAICYQTPVPFRAVGMWYDDFDQVSDKEVVELLQDQYALEE